MKQSFWDIQEASPIIETPTTANLLVESTIESLEPIVTSSAVIATEERNNSDIYKGFITSLWVFMLFFEVTEFSFQEKIFPTTILPEIVPSPMASSINEADFWDMLDPTDTEVISTSVTAAVEATTEVSPHPVHITHSYQCC